MRRFHHLRRFCAAMMLLMTAFALLGARPARADETQVNTTTTGDQGKPSVAVNALGASVVVWQGPGSSGLDIFAQRYNSSGNPVGGEFLVNDTDTSMPNNQYDPAVAINANGAFVITWTSNGQDDSQDMNGAGIYAKRYDANGVKIGNISKINSTTQGDQQASCVGIASDGTYVVAWLDTSAGHTGIYFQRYNASGKLGGETKANGTTVSAGEPSIAVDSNLNFTVAWDAQSAGGGLRAIFAQRYNSNGSPNGAQLNVSNDAAHDQLAPSVALNDSGSAVFAWQSDRNGGTGYDVYAQRYSSGSPAGGEFRANSYTDSDQNDAQVSINASGQFVIVWQSLGQDGDQFGIYGQRYFNDGSVKGAEFQANATTTNTQDSPGVGLGNDNFMVVWQSLEQDGSGYGIYGDRFVFNVPPTSQNKFVPLDEDTQVTFTLSASDPDGKPLTYQIVTSPQHGMLSSGNGATRTYTPAKDYNGRDSFTFKANNGTSDSNVSEVVFAIQGINDAPVAQSQSVTTLPNKAKYIFLKATDLEEGSLTYSVTQPTHGTVVNANSSNDPRSNVYLYTPDAGYTGPDSFTFKANDGKIDSAPATVSINVNFTSSSGPNRAPVTQGSFVFLNEDTQVTFTLRASDPDGNSLTYFIPSGKGPKHGTLSGTGATRTYTPDANYNGRDTLLFNVIDNPGSGSGIISNQSEVVFAIQGINDAPVAQPQSVTTPPNRARYIFLKATDVDDAAFTYIVPSETAHGTLKNANSSNDPRSNAYLYTPNAGYTGPDSFTFKANDGKIDSAPATVSINVQ